MTSIIRVYRDGEEREFSLNDDACDKLSRTLRTIVDPGADLCDSPSPDCDEFPPYTCTRVAGHKGPHVAHGTSHPVCAVWTDRQRAKAHFGPMTPEHPRWAEFVEKMNGPQGCNFSADVDENGEYIPSTITWTCGGNDKPFARAILEKMGNIDIGASFDYFEEHGGYCDCEIVFNVFD